MKFLILMIFVSGCATYHPMPQNYYQYQTSDSPFQIMESGIQVVPNVQGNRCRKVATRGPQSWMGVQYFKEVCQ